MVSVSKLTLIIILIFAIFILILTSWNIHVTNRITPTTELTESEVSSLRSMNIIALIIAIILIILVIYNFLAPEGTAKKVYERLGESKAGGSISRLRRNA